MTSPRDASLRSGLAPETFSPTIRPADDFFRYVNGPWLDTHVIPDDRAGDGHFYRLRDLSEERVRTIIEDAPEDSQIGALYRSFMDEERCDALGTAPLAPDLALVDAAETPAALAAALGTLARTGISGVVSREVWADPGDPDRMVLWLGQAGIGLPDEAYYR